MKYLLFVPAVVAIGRVLAAAGDSPWAYYGIPGAVIAGLVVTKSLVPGFIYQENRTELREARADIKALTQQIIDNQKVALPALQTSSQVIADALPIVRDALRLRDQRREE